MNKKYYPVSNVIYIDNDGWDLKITTKQDPVGQIVCGYLGHLVDGDPRQWILLGMPEDGPDPRITSWIEGYQAAFGTLLEGTEAARKEVQKYQRDIRRGFCILR